MEDNISGSRKALMRVEIINMLFIFVIVTSVLSFTFPRWADPNQNSRLDMIFAVVDQRTFQIDAYVDNTVDYAKVGNHYYSDKAPGVAFLGIPIYVGLKQLFPLPIIVRLTSRLEASDAFQSTLREDGSGVNDQKVRMAIAQVVLTVALSVIPTAVIASLIYRYLGTFSAETSPRILLSFMYAFLTPAFAYGSSLYGHQLSALFLFSAFVGMSKGWFDDAGFKGIFLGVLLAASVITEYPAIIAALPIILWAFIQFMKSKRWGSIVAMAAGALPIAAGFLAYNYFLFGGLFELGYEHSELWQSQHSVGFLSLSVPSPEALLGISFSLYRGLFVLSPWLMLFFPGIIIWLRNDPRKPEPWLICFIVISFFLFNSSSGMWWGGFAVGPRYLLPALPFMLIPIIHVLRIWSSSFWLKFVLLLTAIWSFLANWGLTLANQAFPSDTIFNPLLEYALPNWLEGNVARNIGHLMGMRGIYSFILLLGIVVVLTAIWVSLGSDRFARTPSRRR